MICACSGIILSVLMLYYVMMVARCYEFGLLESASTSICSSAYFRLPMSVLKPVPPVISRFQRSAELRQCSPNLSPLEKPLI